MPGFRTKKQLLGDNSQAITIASLRQELDRVLSDYNDVLRRAKKAEAAVQRFRKARETLWRAGFAEAVLRMTAGANLDEKLAWMESAQHVSIMREEQRKGA